MKRNEGTLDRVLRVVAAAGAVTAAAIIGFATVAGVVLSVVAVVLLLTAATGFCPLYAVLGINTCPRPAQKVSRVRVGAAS